MAEALPPLFTNQHIIDAFYNVASAAGLTDKWSLLISTGLNLQELAANRPAPYEGPPIADLPALSDDQRSQLVHQLQRLCAGSVQWRGVVDAPAGLSLRAAADGDAERLTVLHDGVEVEVLAEAGDWLYVRAEDRIGYVHSNFVGKANSRSTVAAQPGFLWQHPRLAAAPLAPASETAIPVDAARMSWQQSRLTRIWNRYGGLLQALADELGFDPKVAVAVFATEAGPYVLAESERMVIRFENHVFYNEWGRHHSEVFDRHFRFMRQPPGNVWEGHQWRPHEDEAWRPCHVDQDSEWAVLDFACSLEEEAANRSMSMGIAQIMGFNHGALGYASATEMCAALNGDVRRQIFGFFDFVARHPGTVEALRNEDFLTFARIYNGPGQMETYETLIDNNHKALEAAAAPQDMPMPGALPRPIDSDPALHEAWRDHIKQGLANNQKMFSEILDAFMRPYETTVWMYRILFGVGIISVLAALWLALVKDNVIFSTIFLGMSVASFLTYFLSKPLRSLEENLQFITWLGIIYNTYWTRQAFMLDEKTVQADLEDATQEAISQLERLIDNNAALDARRPGSNQQTQQDPK